MLLQDQALAFVASLAAQCSKDSDAIGPSSSSVYDSAWVSLIRKNGDWLFPECFDFVLNQQLPSGAWDSYSTPLDGILNTAAGLLALKKHLHHHNLDQDDLIQKSLKAESALKHLTCQWDINSVDQIGFELLVVSLLELLEQEGVLIEFPQLDALKALGQAKLAKMPTEMLYREPSSLHHSLEALFKKDNIDFDRVGKWLEPDGSMLHSPSSTAAYLMSISVWDARAEEYLRRVVSRHGCHDYGSVPTVWPTTIFKISWSVCALSAVEISIGQVERIVFGSLLKTTLAKQQGLVGFAPGGLPDSDDTAKALEALHHLSQREGEVESGVGSVDALIRTYEGPTHFRTHPGERNPSLSANCNILILLLSREDRDEHLPQIIKASRFLIDKVLGGWDDVNEKWHTKEQYWMMLLCRAFDLLHQVPAATSQKIFQLAPDLKEKVPFVSLVITTRLLQTQQSNGSWEDICEVTAYSILTLSSLLKLPSKHHALSLVRYNCVADQLIKSKSWLVGKREEWKRARNIWTGKVTYGSSILSEAYCLAAALAPVPVMEL
ncbi:hypothetical protein QBC38DRAFT_396604 [Podospora fimiseda]|uniref:Uncharacterized protein n=1 Tax=Podospora fimiseda TaxID=252190 RepID=A0AAN7BK77_9PEZI|nr:hypothetical protein QBC38DRAFT_396604 [Podospora fimiseda]